jgi:alpha-L-fucosidase
MTRRETLQLMAAGAAAAVSTASAKRIAAPAAGDADREARMKWWHEARFGMFIHWGLYSTLGRHEWVMEEEGIPVAEYEQQAKLFKPKPNAARDWAKLAKMAGQKYMVMTTKHHEGFCNFDTKLTNYCAPKQGPGRDLVKEYVEAARAEGLRVGFYYSLMDWHHPDGARCDRRAGAPPLRRLHSRPGPRTADQLRQDRRAVVRRELAAHRRGVGIRKDEHHGLPAPARDHRQQPQRAAGRFRHSRADHQGRGTTRAWESCMTMNGSWGYQKADDDWKTPKTIVRNLITCAHDTGNYLLNIGPKPTVRFPRNRCAS